MPLFLAASPGPGPMWGAETLPELHARPCCRPCPLSASPARACSTPPAALLPASLSPGNMPISLLHPALAVVHCAGVRAREAEGLPGAYLDPEISVSPLISEPLAASLPAPRGLSLPDGRFRGGGFLFVCFYAEEKKKSIQLCRGVALFCGFVIFLVWFGFHFSRRLVAVPRHLTSLFPALSSSTDATRWQF